MLYSHLDGPANLDGQPEIGADHHTAVQAYGVFLIYWWCGIIQVSLLGIVRRGFLRATDNQQVNFIDPQRFKQVLSKESRIGVLRTQVFEQLQASEFPAMMLFKALRERRATASNLSSAGTQTGGLSDDREAAYKAISGIEAASNLAQISQALSDSYHSTSR